MRTVYRLDGDDVEDVWGCKWLWNEWQNEVSLVRVVVWRRWLRHQDGTVYRQDEDDVGDV